MLEVALVILLVVLVCALVFIVKLMKQNPKDGNARLQAQLESLEEQLESEKNNKDEIEQNLTEQQLKISNLREDNGRLEAEKKSESDRAELLRNERDELRAGLDREQQLRVNAEKENEIRKNSLQGSDEKIKELKNDIELINAEKKEQLKKLESDYERKVTSLKQDHIATQKDTKEDYQQRLDKSVNQLKETEAKYDAEHELRISAEAQAKETQVKLDEQEKRHEALKSELHESREKLKNEFKVLADKILKENGQTFKQQNNESLDSLLKPFKEQLNKFETEVKEAKEKQVATHASFSEQFKRMTEMNTSLGAQAEDLAKALKGDKKMQGCWGEVRLEQLLESSGLKKGESYDMELSLNNDEGDRQRPDCVIHLPDGKKLVIDSKVSLNAFLDYSNTDNKEDKLVAGKKHVEALKKHIKDLHERKYSDLFKGGSPDFTFMFVPLEPAFIAALEVEPTLVSQAFEKRVCIVTPSTLLASLGTIASLWSIEKQNKNTYEIAQMASKMHHKFCTFLEKMKDVERRIQSLNTAYDSAGKTLSGKGGLVKIAEDFKDLGVKVSKEIPSSFNASSFISEDESRDIIELGESV